MRIKTLLAAAVVTLSATPLVAASYRTPVPATFESRGADRRAIEALLETYTRAVSTKNHALFESLLLDTAIPFAEIPVSGKAGSGLVDTARYEDFRKGVFEGEPFIQRFQNIHIEQDGELAQVSLVFVNSTAKEEIWGWKTMQLVRVGGRWKIAAEFFTGHE